MRKIKLLIVGSFPANDSSIVGGIRTSCDLISNYAFKEGFIVKTIDSTQITNPAPNLFIRLILAGKRLISLILKCTLYRPNQVLIFVSDGASAIEKGIMIIIAKLYLAKVIITPRAGNLITQTEKSRIFKSFVKYSFNKANLILAQGNKWKSYCNDNLQIPLKNISILNNWTATPQLLEIGKNRDPSQFTKKILFTGWVEKEKGIQELFYAAKELINEGLLFELNIVGHGNQHSVLANQIDHDNLGALIKLHGWCDQFSIIQKLAENDIFVLPSWQEGFPNSIIEAMSARMPIISTDVGTICDHLKDSHNAIIVKPKDYLSLKNAIKKLILDDELRKKISLNAYNYAFEHFSSERNLKQLEDMLLLNAKS